MSEFYIALIVFGVFFLLFAFAMVTIIRILIVINNNIDTQSKLMVDWLYKLIEATESATTQGVEDEEDY